MYIVCMYAINDALLACSEYTIMNKEMDVQCASLIRDFLRIRI